jgi:hypothetical protein
MKEEIDEFVAAFFPEMRRIQIESDTNTKGVRAVLA